MILRKKPITCDEVRTLLFEYAEDSLDEWEKARVKAHIESCNECKRELSEVRGLLEALPLCAEEPPRSLFDNVMAAIENEPMEEVPTRSKKRLIPYGAIAVACAAVMIVVAGRHVVPMTDSIAIDDGAQKIGEAVKGENIVEVSAAPDEESDDASAKADDKPVTESHNPTLRVIDSGDTVEVSTSSLLVGSPSYTDIQYADSENESYDVGEAAVSDNLNEDKGNTPIGTIFDYVKSADFTSQIAVIVCDEDDIVSDLSEYYSSTLVHRGVTADRYIISENAMSAFVDILSNVDNKLWKLPSDLNSFKLFHLYLITDSAN